jgi:alpha-tubulin suppressor-like RCC1 family protein
MFLSRCEHVSFIVDSQGSVWACGNNYSGMFGTGEGSSTSRFIQVPTWKHIVSLDSGGGFTLGLDEFGMCWSSGSVPGTSLNTQVPVQIGGMPKIKQISCGIDHFLALDEHHSIWGCGDNQCGQLGVSDVQNRAQPTQIPSFAQVHQISCGYGFSLALDERGNIWSFGRNDHGQLGK